MATGKRLLEKSMPHNYKQGTLYPTHYDDLESLMQIEDLVMLDMFVKMVSQRLDDS